MSVIPVREALTLLENENLVQNIPYRGFMVTGIVFDDFLEYSLIRNEMECLALRFGLRGLIEGRLFGALGAYSHEIAGCIVNAGCLLALALVGFTALYAVGLAHSVTALIAAVAALLVLLGVALVRGW